MNPRALYTPDFATVHSSLELVSLLLNARMLPGLNSSRSQFLRPTVLLIALLGTMSSATAAALTNTAQLRALPAATAALQLPVKLRATVTAFNPSSIFLQDDSGGTFINFPTYPPSGCAVGDVLEIEGVTYPGRFLPGITSARFEVIGQAPLPAAVPVDFDDLLAARHHYERVRVSGVVRSVARATDGERVVLTLALGARRLEVQIASPGSTNFPALVDARVRIAGLAAGYINNRRQLLAPQLLVNQLADVQIEIPPPVDTFSVPLTSASALLNFNPDGIAVHRVRVRGVVTQRQPGEALFLRDGEDGLLVQTAQADPVHPGDIVEAVGFPAMGRFSAFLEDAQFRVTGTGEDPQPLPISLTEALTGTNDANLITIEAQLLEMLENPAETLLVLRSEDIAFRARMPRARLNLRNGSHVRLAGVCRVEEFSPAGAGFGASPRSIELLLRSPSDISVLSAPSGWTVQRLAITAAVLLGMALTAFGWVALLRRRVAEQARIIREKVQREAALEERHRMAREMHDTLAQSFSGLGFQLEALSARLPENADAARNQLETARQMVRHGQEGFRRSLLNLRAQELEHGSLTDALTELARHVTAGSGIELYCDVQRSDQPLPEAVEANLLRIGQECLANAVRHGNPQRIELSFRHEPGRVELRIADDGAGFDPAQLAHAANGHFGWRGIRERAEQIGAHVELKSQPGRGTSVTVVVLTEK